MQSTADARSRTSLTALGFVTLSAILFAAMNVFARLATASASWATVAAVRAIVGAIVAFAVARARGRSLGVVDRRAVLWRSVSGTLAMLLTFYALSSRALSLGDTVTLLNLAPIFLALLAPTFLGERTSLTVFAALVVALSGVVLVVQPASLFGAHAAEATVALRGPSAAGTALVAVLAALSSSVAMMLLRRAGRTESAEAIAFHFSSLAAIVMGALSLLDPRLPSARDALFMVAAGLSAGFAQLAVTHAYTIESAARVSGMSYLTVVASALFGAGALGERPGPAAIAGMGLVVASGLLVTRDGAARPRLG